MKRRTLFIAIIINAALYAALVALYPLAQGLLKPRLMWAQQNSGSLFLGIAHVAICVALFVMYVAAVRRASNVGGEALAESEASAKASPPIALIILGWLLFTFILLFAFPGESADVFDYVFRGRMLAEYGLSPLAHTPVEISNMPFHRYISWSDWVDAYGPIWEYASAAVSALVRLTATPAELLVHINQTCDVQPAVCTLITKYVIGYRLLSVGLTGACGWLVWQIVKRQTSNASVAAMALLAWLWNPLVLISTAIGAHNDALMLVFVLLAIWLTQRERWLFAVLALFAAAHVKITALVMLPVLCLWMAHRLGWKRATIITFMSFAIALPISFALYGPLGGWATLPRNLYERTLLSTNSIGELLYRYLRESVGLVRPRAQQIASRVAQAIFTLLATSVLLVAWRCKANPKGLEDPSGFWLRLVMLVTVSYLAIGSFWFQPWYLMWPIALAAVLLPRRTTITFIATLSASALCAAVFKDYASAQAGSSPWSGLISIVTVVLTWLPPVIATQRWRGGFSRLSHVG